MGRGQAKTSEILGGGGWPVVEAAMERGIAAGVSTREDYERHLEGGDGPRLMDSFEHYVAWKQRNPGLPVPAAVARIRSDKEHAEWAKRGFPITASRGARA